jgi:NAD(P)-dependent dehydrogenase (short-subunit alcohol dehydrogenase family)
VPIGFSAPLEMKRIVITGANSGIGLATAKFLASRHELILLCRTQAKGEQAKAEILRIAPAAQIQVWALDLHDLGAVKQVAHQLRANFNSIDVLINNAGYYPERVEYVGVVEKTLYASHLGHMLLTLLLMPRLEQVADARIINVSSGLHPRGNADHLFTQVRDLVPFQAYADAKLANILFTLALKAKTPGHVRAFSLHPGVVATGFDRSVKGWFKMMISVAKPLFFISPEAGAETSIYLATAPLTAIESHAGGYFAKSKPARIQNPGATQAQAARLWEQSMSVLQPFLT